ncbi:MAG: helix-hairpin-helix domain-containing protein [Prevotella sp.]|nr:helix-hairpin-helix domain-containing protein [Prevotellaceae bacterium]MDY3936467.1 helix-hairpin-helix domain-containing protein [Prevotella sp.]
MQIQDFFYLQKSDRKVILFLLGIAIACFLFIYFIGGKEMIAAQSPKENNSTTAEESASSENKNNATYAIDNTTTAELFPFDPNTADSTELHRLGLAPYQIKNIYKYRAKGGIYRAPEDFARLYGLTRKQYRALAPYIIIGDDYLPASTLPQVKNYHEQKLAERQKAKDAYERYKASDTYKPYKEYDRDTIKFPIKIKVGEHINLANADTTMLKKVPGIGSGLAKAIVAYGKRLGGYVEVGQLKEIEQFPEESLIYFEVKNPQPKKLNINQLPVNQLRTHPYINFYMAREIQEYRRLKGNLSSLSQLRFSKDFTPEVIRRLTPYVTF